MLCLWLASPAARSQAPTVSYTGGSSTANGAAAVSYGPTTDPFAGYGGGAGGHGPAGYYTKSSGAIQATLAWPKGVLPTAVIVQEHCTAKWNSDGDAKQTGGDDCALPNPTVVNFGPYKGESHEGYRYTGYSSPAANTLALPAISPSASATGVEADGDLGDSIAYAVTAYPITISLTGTTPDASGNANILVGQGCTANLSGIPPGCTVTNYQWSASGTTFQNWTLTQNLTANPATSTAKLVPGFGLANQSTAHWFWSDKQHSQTVTCAATVTPPAGQGSPFTVTVTKSVNLEVPAWTASNSVGSGRISYYQPPNTDFEMWAGPTGAMINNGFGNGSNWKTAVPMPSGFTGTGQWSYAQIITPGEYETPNGGTEKQSLQTGLKGIDLAFPYPDAGFHNTDTIPITDGDAPGMAPLDTWTIIRLADRFKTYLMFKPPQAASAPNDPAQWVPLAETDWNTSFSASRPGTGHWTDYNPTTSVGTVNLLSDFVPQYQHPEWTQRIDDNIVFP